MHHECDRDEGRTPDRVRGGDDEGIAVDADGETGRIERELEVRRRRAVGGSDGEPLPTEREPRRPGQGALARVPHGEAIDRGGGAPDRGRVEELPGRYLQGGDRRRRVGELIDPAGGQQNEWQRARQDARDVPTGGPGEAAA